MHDNKPEFAEKILLDALPYFELSPVLFNDLGNFYYGQGKIDMALKYYDKALAIDKDYAKAYGNLAYAAIENGQFKVAINQFKKANANEPIKFNVEDFRSLFLAKTESLFSAGKADTALNAINYYLAELPNHTDLQFALGKANYLTGKPANAALNLNELNGNELRFQEKYSYWQLLGWINIDLEKNENAKACFLKSTQFSANPDRLGLALLAFADKDHVTAKKTLQNAIQFNNNALDIKKLSIIYSKKSLEKINKMITEIIK